MKYRRSLSTGGSSTMAAPWLMTDSNDNNNTEVPSLVEVVKMRVPRSSRKKSSSKQSSSKNLKLRKTKTAPVSSSKLIDYRVSRAQVQDVSGEEQPKPRQSRMMRMEQARFEIEEARNSRGIVRSISSSAASSDGSSSVEQDKKVALHALTARDQNNATDQDDTVQLNALAAFLLKSARDAAIVKGSTKKQQEEQQELEQERSMLMRSVSVPKLEASHREIDWTTMDATQHSMPAAALLSQQQVQEPPKEIGIDFSDRGTHHRRRISQNCTPLIMDHNLNDVKLPPPALAVFNPMMINSSKPAKQQSMKDLQASPSSSCKPSLFRMFPSSSAKGLSTSSNARPGRHVPSFPCLDTAVKPLTR